MRLIDADALKELFSEVIGRIAIKPEMNGNLEHMIRASAMVIQMIDDAPSIQPERKTGRWIKTARWGRVYYCDQCRNYLDFDGVNAGRGSTNFCPNCGAKMERRQDGH